MTQPQPLTPPASPPAMPGSSGAPALQARTTVGGFETQRVIARSASTVVYLAADLALGMPVALQEYLPSRLVLRDARQGLKALSPANADAVARGRQAFIDESRMLVRCEHPALVRVLHLFEANGTAYRVMPYREGRRLLDLRREMPEPPDEAALRALLDALLGALDAIHQAGHVHGGVTPANILLLTDDSPLLLGPGAAGQAIGHGTDTPPSAGPAMPFAPPAGASPRDALGPWVDFYGLAQVIRFCISGRLPASANAVDPFPSLAEAIEQSFEPAVRTLYSPALLETIEAASSPLAADRPDSVAQFRAWLGQGAVMPPTQPPTPPDIRPRAPAPPDVRPRAPMNPPASAPAIAPKPVARAAPRPAVVAGPPATPMAADSFAKTRPMPSAGAPWNPAANATALRRRRLGWAAGTAAVVGALAIAAGIWRLLPAPRASAAPDAVAEQAAVPVAAAPIAAADGVTAASAPAELVLAPAVPPAVLPLPEVPPAATAPPPAPEQLIASAPPAAAPTPALVRPAAESAAAARAARAAAVAKARADATAKARADAAAKRAAAPAQKRTAAAAAAVATGTPRTLCAPRTEFALYRCMQVQCNSAKWSGHPQCQRLQKTDRVE
jgi:serine/threonine protein kinase